MSIVTALQRADIALVSPCLRWCAAYPVTGDLRSSGQPLVAAALVSLGRHLDRRTQRKANETLSLWLWWRCIWRALICADAVLVDGQAASLTSSISCHFACGLLAT
jgi:hypothetical protein